jgi:Ca-activated chloride channel family protein
MTRGIRAALSPPIPEGRLRIVVFLTDGYIGNDVDVVRLIRAERGEARLFSFGVGNAVNRYLLEEMARAGRGVARIVKPGDDDADEAAELLANRLEAPYLTDLSIDWGDAPVREAAPAILPDLFLGESVRVLARFDGPGAWRITVHGRVAGRPVKLPLDVLLPAEAAGAEALPILWARAQIDDRMIDYLDPARDAAQRERLRGEVIALGLEHRLVTQWTSLVAVAPVVENRGGAGAEADVPVARVEGVSAKAYSGGSFGGHAAPEPASWAAIGLVGAMAAGWIRRRRQRWGAAPAASDRGDRIPRSGGPRG